jgi:hypothetical protein
VVGDLFCIYSQVTKSVASQEAKENPKSLACMWNCEFMRASRTLKLQEW